MKEKLGVVLDELCWGWNENDKGKLADFATSEAAAEIEIIAAVLFGWEVCEGIKENEGADEFVVIGGKAETLFPIKFKPGLGAADFSHAEWSASSHPWPQSGHSSLSLDWAWLWATIWAVVSIFNGSYVFLVTGAVCGWEIIVWFLLGDNFWTAVLDGSLTPNGSSSSSLYSSSSYSSSSASFSSLSTTTSLFSLLIL